MCSIEEGRCGRHRNWALYGFGKQWQHSNTSLHPSFYIFMYECLFLCTYIGIFVCIYSFLFLNVSEETSILFRCSYAQYALMSSRISQGALKLAKITLISFQ